MLNASCHFKDIVESCHAVVLAGGTMQPMSDYVQHLMPSLSPLRLRTMSLGHVVPDENILPLTLSTGPTGLRCEREGRWVGGWVGGVGWRECQVKEP